MMEEIGYKLFEFLLTILILILFPIFLVLTVPFIIFRFIVKKLALCRRQKLGKMVTTRGCVYAAEDYTNCPTCNVIFTVVLEGQVDLENAKGSAEKRLLEARLPNGDAKYPELKQYVKTWMGYYFWKDDKKFDINNHIKIHRGYKGEERFTDDDLQELKQNMLQEPWAKKRPLWEITFVPNYYPADLRSPGPHTALIVRLHHTLGDGYSWIPLIVQELCQSDIKFPVPNYPNRNFCGNILDQITFPFRASYHFADALSIGFRRNVPFGIKIGMPIGKYNTAVSNIISIKKIKEIGTHFNVCFSSVISAALAGAMRDLLILKRMKIPEILHGMATQPLPGHSPKLRNYFTGVLLKYPIGEDNPVKRLKYCDANYKEIKKSAQPRLFDYGWVLMGSYFSWMIKYIGQNHTVTSTISNLPGPSTDSVHFNGHKWLDFMITAGLQPGVNGLGVSVMSFAGGVRISLNAATLSTEEVNELSALISKHIDILNERFITDV